jgi:hypothetical protein
VSQDKRSGGASNRPPRYNDLDLADDNAPAATVRSSNAPASTARIPLGDSAEAFDRNTREDSPESPDRAKRRSNSSDPVSYALGLEAFTSGAHFPFCLDGYGREMPFSRLYTAPDVLVDLFANDSDEVRTEVAKKRAAVEAHNTIASDDIAAMTEAAEKNAVAAKKRDDQAVAAGVAPKSAVRPLSHYIAAELSTGVTYLRREGRVPFAYVPILGAVREGDVDFEALLKHVVLDLPPAAAPETWEPIGVGVRVTHR